MPMLPLVLSPLVLSPLVLSPLVLSSDSHVFEPPDLWQTASIGPSGIVRRGSSGSTAPTRSSSRRIRSSPGSASSRTPDPLEHRRYDGSEYEPFWAGAEALDMPLSLHTATRRQGRIRGAGDETLRDASSGATKAFYPALSLCDLIFSGGIAPIRPSLRS
jgi:hypothetical protein